MLSHTHPKKRDKILQQIQDITNQGMDGSLDFRSSLTQRLALLHAQGRHSGTGKTTEPKQGYLLFPSAIKAPQRPSGYRLCRFQRLCGLHHPGDCRLRADCENVFANEFLYDEEGFVTGFNPDIRCHRSGGKSQVIKNLKLKGMSTSLATGKRPAIRKVLGLCQ